MGVPKTKRCPVAVAELTAESRYRVVSLALARAFGDSNGDPPHVFRPAMW